MKHCMLIFALTLFGNAATAQTAKKDSSRQKLASPEPSKEKAGAKSQPAQSTHVAATVVEFKGTAFVLISPKTQKQKITKSMKLPEGTKIVTEKKSSVKLQLADKSVISIGAKTTFKLTQVNTDATKTILDLSIGKAKAFVLKRPFSNGGGSPTYKIKTPAAVAGVRGTQFVVSVTQSGPQSEIKSSVYCLSGAVSVESLDGKPLADVKAGLFTVVSGKESDGGSVVLTDTKPKVEAIPENQAETLDSEEFLLIPPSDSNDALDSSRSSGESSMMDSPNHAQGISSTAGESIINNSIDQGSSLEDTLPVDNEEPPPAADDGTNAPPPPNP